MYEEQLLAELLPGPKPAAEINMAERTRRKYARLLEAQGLLARVRDRNIGHATVYELTRSGKLRAIELGLLPPVVPYFADIYIRPLPDASLELVEWAGEWLMAGGLIFCAVWVGMRWSHFIPH